MTNKYHARRTWSALVQREFASKAECLHGEDLWMQERAGVISQLRFQVLFVLSVKPKVTITIDFQYDKDGHTFLEDTKGVLTRDFRTKLAWLRQLRGIEVKLIAGAKG